VAVAVWGRDHERAHEVVVCATEKVPKADDPDDPTLLVDHRQGVDGLGISHPLPDRGQRGSDAVVRVGGHVLRAHPAPDGLLGVAEDRGGESSLVVRQSLQQSLGDRGGKLIEQPHAVVGVQVSEQGHDLAVLQPLDEFTLKRGLERLEDIQRLLLGQQAVDDGPLAGVQPFDEVDHGAGRQP
jgi:hypothetical protein